MDNDINKRNNDMDEVTEEPTKDEWQDKADDGVGHQPDLYQADTASDVDEDTNKKKDEPSLQESKPDDMDESSPS